MNYIPSFIVPHTIDYYLFKISHKSQAIYLTFAFVIVFIMASLPLIYVDVTVSESGSIDTRIERQMLHSPSEGFVVYSTIQSNKKVQAGDTLLIIDSQAPVSQLTALFLRKNENNQSIKDLYILVTLDSTRLANNDVSLESSGYITAFSSFRRKYLNQHNNVNNRISNHGRMEYLFHREVVSEKEYEASLFALEQELAILNHLLLHQVNVWQNDLNDRLAQQAIIEAEICNLEQEVKKRYLIAPLDGSIISSADVKAGRYLSLNQKIAELSPAGHLIVTALVNPINAGYLHEMQKVRIQVDAYNYNQWGMLDAVIYDISDDVIIDPITNKPYYRVRCDLFSDSLVHRNGAVGKLKKGMTVRCRFVQGRVSLFDLLVKRADNWLNPANP